MIPQIKTANKVPATISDVRCRVVIESAQGCAGFLNWSTLPALRASIPRSFHLRTRFALLVRVGFFSIRNKFRAPDDSLNSHPAHEFALPNQRLISYKKAVIGGRARPAVLAI